MAYRGLVVSATIMSLLADLLLYTFFNLASWIGGPLAGAASAFLSIAAGAALFFLPLRPWLIRLPVIALVGVTWLPLRMAIYRWADPIQVRLYQDDAVRTTRRFTGGSLPAGCTIGLPARANSVMDFTCTTPYKTVVAFFDSKLKGWSKSVRKDFTEFRRPGLWGKKDVVHVDDQGTAWFWVSPTWFGG